MKNIKFYDVVVPNYRFNTMSEELLILRKTKANLIQALETIHFRLSRDGGKRLNETLNYIKNEIDRASK